uniref:Uncharacterized protein n=1 Tax=Sphaerodactylus townsendi TaxID=933632 RepID=A0ACB8FFW3_9SAUR
MNTHNLAIVFGPTLFQTDGKDYKAGRVVEDLIRCYVDIFSVELRKRCCDSRRKSWPSHEDHGSPALPVGTQLVVGRADTEILDRRKVTTKDKDYWSCFEVNERDEVERPLHYSEKVLPIVHGLGKDSYLVVKRHGAMEPMLVYTGKVEAAIEQLISLRVLGKGSCGRLRRCLPSRTSVLMAR